VSTTPEDRIRAQWRSWWRRTGQYRLVKCGFPCYCDTGEVNEHILTPGEKTLELARQWGKSCADIKRIVRGK